jgi:hypothetical protein
MSLYKRIFLLNLGSLFLVSLFSMAPKSSTQQTDLGIYSDPTFTMSQQDIQLLNKFLGEVTNPVLSIPQKIAKYNMGIDDVIKIDSAATTMDSFIMTFIGFVTNINASDKATIDDLQKLFDLYAKIRGSSKLKPEQREKLSIGYADAIKRKLEIQRLFKSQLMSAANALDFNSKFYKYQDLFVTGLNKDINQENRELWVISMGQLVSAALTAGKKASDDIKSFLSDILKTKLYEKQNKLFSDDQKKRLSEYLQLFESKPAEKSQEKPAGVGPNPETKPTKPVAKNSKNIKILAKK